MAAYFWLLLAQSLVALVVLAVAGGWALTPFASERRPYLWLAAPLCGIGVLSLSLYVLYHAARLTVPWAFVAALAVNGALTFGLWWRAEWRRPAWRHLGFGLVLALVCAAAAVRVVDGEALVRGEPTVVVAHGSDQFGYSHAADWLLQHPHEQPAGSAERPYECWLSFLWEYDTRHGVFLLLSAASWLRGTSGLFSYDFATTVAFIAALVGFAGAFARRPALVVALLVAVALSLWLRQVRQGFFGKVAAYPGIILVVGLVLETWTRWTPGRTLVCVTLALGFTLCHNPLALVAAVGFSVAGLIALVLAAKAARLVVPRLRQASWELPAVWRGVVLLALVVTPALLMFPRTLREVLSLSTNRQVPEWPADFVLAEALDVNMLYAPVEATAQLRYWLIGLALAAAAVAAVMALWARSLKATALLLTAAVVVTGTWLGRKWSVYQLQGLFYPLMLVGAALVAESIRARRSMFCAGLAFVPVFLLAAPRVPQLRDTYEIHTGIDPNSSVVLVQSQFKQLATQLGSERVDIAHFDLRTAVALLLELGRRGVPFQLREPAWTMCLAYTHLPPRQYEEPGRFLITPYLSDRACAVQTCPQWRVVHNEGVWIGKIDSPRYGIAHSVAGEHWTHVDRQAVQLTLYNGGRVPVRAALVGRLNIAPGSEQASDCKLLWTYGTQQGHVMVAGMAEQPFEVVLDLTPGDNLLTLIVEQRGTEPPANGIVRLARFGLHLAAPSAARVAR
jgi:hypothetical protein